MVTHKAIYLTVGIFISFLTQTQGDDKYTDGNRPYEFGFSIDGEQHRHEKKDERGLIMGEFGFITADGVYHVTVYATDEQGRFKILSMKNIRMKPYPSYKQSAGSARQGHSLDVPTQQQNVPVQKPDAFKKISLEKPGKSCSSCSIPTTSTAAPIAVFAPYVQNTPIGSNVNKFAQNPASGNPQIFRENMFSPVQPNGLNNYSPQQNLGPSPNFPANQVNNFNSFQTPPDQELVAPKQDSPRYPTNNDAQYPQQPGSLPAFTEQPASNYPQPDAPAYPPLNSESPQNNPFGPQNSFPATGKEENQNGPQEFGPVTSAGVQSGRTAEKLDRDQKQLSFTGARPSNSIPNQGEAPKKPTLISAQMQIVDRNTDIYKRGPGEKEGLPNGLTKDDMTQLLYTFNYTVGFHGHFEEGYRSGGKQGYYYVTGRNGVQTRVDYVADENGFRPKITQEVLDLLSEDVPKAETEKDEKYGLKGYEFKWLYYPVETKGR